jgi:hypothetical protein
MPTEERKLPENDASKPSSQPRLLPPEWPSYTDRQWTPENGSVNQPPENYSASPESAANSASGPADDSTMVPSRQNRSLAPWAGPVILITAVGALGQAWVGYEGRITGTPSAVLFYLTLCMIYAPSAALILSRQLTDNAKILFSVYMSLALLVTRFLQYPTAFVGHDEFVHESIALQIDRTGHLFHPLNSILPEASYYPGMEIVTTALQHATGLSLHMAGCVVLALAFVISTLALIQIMRRITGSVTAACLAALIYLCNQETLYFNTSFSYASLAMPMAFFCIYVFSIRSRSRKIYGLIPVLAVFVSLAATHHLTSLAVVIVLWFWNRLTKQLTGRREPQLFIFYLLCLLVTALWTWFARAYVISYIRESLASSVVSIERLIDGKGGRKLFSTPAGYKTPQWEVIVSFGSVLLIVIILIPALSYVINRWRLIGAAGIVLTALALTYPAIPFGHLTNASSEVADRSSPFIFCGIAYVVAIWWFRRLSTNNAALLTSFLGSQRLFRLGFVRRPLAFLRRPLGFVRRPRLTPALVLSLTFCFVGGGIIGASDFSYTPGKYIVSADERSIDQLALAAGSWESANIKPNSRFVGDRDNSLVAQFNGGLHSVTPAADKVDEGSISNLLLRYLAPSDINTVCTDHIQYLIADVRLSTALPELGVYMDEGEYLDGTRTAPPSVADLTKFDQVPGAERIYDNGAIRIFDLEGLSCPG